MKKRLKTRKEKAIDYIMTLFFLLGLFLIPGFIYIYDHTFITWLIPFAFMLTAGIITTLFTAKLWDKHILETHFILKFAYNTLSFGSVFCYLFLALNYHITEPDKIESRYKIIGRSEIRSKGHSSAGLPRVTINLSPGTKQLYFMYTEKNAISNSDSIEFTVNKGILGFDVITGYKFIENKRKYYSAIINKPVADKIKSMLPPYQFASF